MKRSYRNKNSMARFLEGKGFYIVLVACAVAIGIASYVAIRANIYSPENTLTDNGTSQIQTQADEPANLESPPTDTTSEEPASITDNQTEEKVQQTDAKPAEESTAAQEQDSGEAVETAATAFVKPVAGNIIVPFSIDDLIYSSTMDDWRVHTGVDIAANEGTQVCAMAAGTVEDVYLDEGMGQTVVIKHSDKLRSVYSNLGTSVTVSKGDSVKMGQVIGGVGKTAAFEISEEPHVHIEVLKDGKFIDPTTLFPK